MALALSLRTPLFLGSVFGWGMMGPWMMGGFGFSPLMMLGPLVFWGLVIWGMVVLVKHYSRPVVAAGPPLEILRQPYAEGEITGEKFGARKKRSSLRAEAA